jgi:hypothetical protein
MFIGDVSLKNLKLSPPKETFGEFFLLRASSVLGVSVFEST